MVVSVSLFISSLQPSTLGDVSINIYIPSLQLSTLRVCLIHLHPQSPTFYFEGCGGIHIHVCFYLQSPNFLLWGVSQMDTSVAISSLQLPTRWGVVVSISISISIFLSSLQHSTWGASGIHFHLQSTTFYFGGEVWWYPFWFPSQTFYLWGVSDGYHCIWVDVNNNTNTFCGQLV